MKILVLGAGATGGYFGAHLVQAGEDVSFLVRPARAAQLVRTGLAVTSPLGDFQTPVRVVTPGDVAPGYDIVLLTCKAYDLEEAIEVIGPAVGPDTAIVPLLNGVAHLERLDRAFGRQRVFGGLCHLAVSMEAEGRIRHLNDFHRLAFGPRGGRDQRAEALATAFEKTPIAVTLSPAIVQAMWEKFVFLATLAGMTCLMRASVGDIMETSQGRALTLELLDSCAEIAALEGYPPDEARLQESRDALTTQGSRLTASMLRDVERGGVTEAQHILGDMVERARRRGVSATLLAIAFTHLQAYEARRRREAADASPELSRR